MKEALGGRRFSSDEVIGAGTSALIMGDYIGK
jgi:hypothetical protein